MTAPASTMSGVEYTFTGEFEADGDAVLDELLDELERRQHALGPVTFRNGDCVGAVFQVEVGSGDAKIAARVGGSALTNAAHACLNVWPSLLSIQVEPA